MQSNNMWIVLAFLVLIFIAICLRNVHFIAYSTEDIMEECNTIRDKYYELQERGASESEWQEFERISQEKLDTIVEDLSDTLHKKPDRRFLYYQFTRYEFPVTIRSRDRGEAMSKAFVKLKKDLAWLEQNEPRQPALEGAGTDPLVVGILLFDGLLAAGVVYLVWPSKEAKAKKVKRSRETLLRQLELLDKKIGKNPASPNYRGVRARLRAELGLREEAIEDIDWLLEKEPHGVDQLTFYELRQSIIKDMEEKDENTDEKR